jgi:hypothetical protein
MLKIILPKSLSYQEIRGKFRNGKLLFPLLCSDMQEQIAIWEYNPLDSPHIRYSPLEPGHELILGSCFLCLLLQVKW